MKVLIIGSGGREHALCWKIAQSRRVKKIYAAPGNGGISEIAELVDIKADDIERLSGFAKRENIDLTVVGPEAPLAAGIVDEFNKEGLRIFGPTKKAAELEASKIFTKNICLKYGICTAASEVFEDASKAKDYVDKQDRPQVIKADGLAAGKGVIVAETKEEARDAIDDIMVNKRFGEAGSKVCIEERLYGEEVSILVFSDGRNIYPLETSQDHKPAFDDDKGPNTGGMGAYSPTSLINEKMYQDVVVDIIRPTVEAMANEGRPYKGILYAGLMVTEGTPHLLEYNVRFGDPETQAILPRMKTDLVEVIEATIDGTLNKIQIEWDERPCICVVAASGGYPGSYEKGKEISGLNKVKGMKDVMVFHAGSKKENGKIFTAGGRVLGVTALGDDIKQAIDKSYEAMDKISFEGMHYRTDIGRKAL